MINMYPLLDVNVSAQKIGSDRYSHECVVEPCNILCNFVFRDQTD